MTFRYETHVGTITGTAGDDVLIGPGGPLPPQSGREVWLFDGGAGNDTVSFTFVDDPGTSSPSDTGLSIFLDRCAASGAVFRGGAPIIPLRAELASIENVTGSQLDDNIGGDAGSNILDGHDGKDKLWSREGDDLLRDGAGVDVLYGGHGRDVFSLAADSRHDGIQDFERGRDKIDISAWNVASIEDLTMTEEVRTGRDGADLYRIRIAFQDELIILRGHDWEVRAADLGQDSFLFSGPDLPVLLGTAADDKLFGTAFAERIIGGEGRDNLWGFGGPDIFQIAADGLIDNIKDFTDGADLIDLNAWGVTGMDDLTLSLGNNNKVQIRAGAERLTVRIVSDEPVTTDLLDDNDFIFA